MSYEEHLLTTGKRAAVQGLGRLACDARGRLVAGDFLVHIDQGAYSEAAGSLTTKMLRFFGAPYRLPHLRGLARTAFSERRAPIRRDFANHLLERDLHLTDIEVRPHSPSIGKTLKELNFRQKCNVNIVTIIRGERRINIPGGDEYLYPLDKLIVVGSDDDILHFHDYIAERYHQADQKRREEEADEMNIEQFTISEDSRLIGLSIRESGIRDKAQLIEIGRASCRERV